MQAGQVIAGRDAPPVLETAEQALDGTPTSLRGLLTNPAYTGQVYAGLWRSRPPRVRRSATRPIGRPSNSVVPPPAGQWLPVATVPALISAALFERAQAKLAQNQAFARRDNTRYAHLLRALVNCGVFVADAIEHVPAVDARWA